MVPANLMKTIPIFLFVCLFCFSNVFAADTLQRFEGEVRNYAFRAIDDPPVPGCTLFVGSSSFALWGKKLEGVFADYEAVNRGFGGSTFPDNLRAMEWIHLPAHPKRIVIFCGGNDIAGGDDAETVFRNFKFYIARTWNENPTAEIYFVSTSHAPVREKFWPTGDELYARVKELSEKVNGLFPIDVLTPMRGENGQVREELFGKDRLHLNDDGYAIWAKVFKEALDAQNKVRSKPNLVALYENRKTAGLFDDPRFAEQGIAIRDYSQPPKKTCLVFLGDSLTEGTRLDDKDGAPPFRCAAYLAASGYDDVTVVNCGVRGFTTIDFLPKGKSLKKDAENVEPFKSDKDTELIFSIMLGTNDSALRETVPPVSPEDYRRNMKAIVDQLLADYPTAKIVIHRPIWYSPTSQNAWTYLLEGQLRLRAYHPELEVLIDYYANSSAKDRVFPGDASAFDYFKTHAENVFISESGGAGAFLLHPNERGSDILGRFWGAAIKRAMQ